MNLPKTYEDEMRELLGAEFEEYIKSLEEPARQGLRVNRAKITPDEFRKICPFSLEPVPWISNGFFLGEEEQASRHPYYFAGLYYLQEPSAMTPASRLPIEEGDYVLDMCAAPGGKATELGSRLGGTGLLVANDISSSRARALLKNLEMAGIPNFYVCSESSEKLESHFTGFFDKVLIDAPCSGEGMFRRDGKMIRYWEERGPEGYMDIQRELLLRGSRMLRPGGKLLYSTCTFSKKEDEDAISWLLKENPSMHLIEAESYEGFSKGKGLTKCVRIFPHKMPGEGHFLALLEKEGEKSPGQEAMKKGKPVKLPECAEEFLKLLNIPLRREWMKLEKDKLYLLPCGQEMPRLRYLRTGLFLGEIRRERFEPSQALAMVLGRGRFASCICLEPDDIRTVKYLKGETIDVSDIPVENKKGWQLVCVNDYPLGFGKLSGGVLKNKYYAGWRWQ